MRHSRPIRPSAIILVAASIGCLAAPAGAQGLAVGPSGPDAQISAYVREVFQDRDGAYWFGTNDEGVCRHDGRSLEFLGIGEGLAGRAVRGIVQDAEGDLWFATDGGVSRRRAGTFTNYTVQDGLSHDETWSILRDRSGGIWVGTLAGVCRFDGARFAPFPLPRVAVERPESRFTPEVVFAMHQDRDGNIWFGTDGEGVHRYDGRGFTSYTTKEGLGGNMVRAICGDRRGRVWIGSDGGGASCFDGSTWRTFTARDGLGNDRVFEIVEDRAGAMWFSTLGAGATRHDETSFVPYGAAQGLGLDELACACGSGLKARECHVPSGIHVQDLFEDREGRLWAGCSGGLFRLEGGSFVNVTRDGPWPPAAQLAAGEVLSVPLSHLSRMLDGEWRVRFANGTTQFDRWTSGPGGHSASAQTFGVEAAGNPWRALAIHYWHPGRREVRFLGFHPEVPSLGRGHSEGSVRLGPDGISVLLDLRQSVNPQRVRRLESRTAFTGPDALRTALLEDAGEGFVPLVEWDYVRSRQGSEVPPLPAEAARPTDRLRALEPLLAQEWEAVATSPEGVPIRLRTTFEWIPLIEVMLVRTHLVAAGGETTPLLEAYLFRPVGTEGMRMLGLSLDGGVFEGHVAVAGLTLEADGAVFDADGTRPRRGRLELGEDGSVRTRIWSGGADEGAPTWDLRHVKRPPSGP